MEEGEKVIIRVVAYQKSIGDGFTIHNIYESYEVKDTMFCTDGTTLKAAIANRVVDGLKDLDVGGCHHLSVYLIKEGERG